MQSMPETDSQILKTSSLIKKPPKEKLPKSPLPHTMKTAFASI